jgi:hypothetical protein
VVIILNAVIMGLETDSESAFFEWTEQVPSDAKLRSHQGSTAKTGHDGTKVGNRLDLDLSWDFRLAPFVF